MAIELINDVINVAEKVKFRINSKNTKDNLLILIGGCSRTGKSTFAKSLCEKLKEIQIEAFTISIDLWLKPASQRESNSTVLDRYKKNEIIVSISELLCGNSLRFSPYDAITRERSLNKILIVPSEKPFVVVLEGVISLCLDELRINSEYNIYLECRNFTRIKRLIKFYKDTKHLDEEQYKNLIRSRENEEVPLIKSSRKFADVVVKL